MDRRGFLRLGGAVAALGTGLLPATGCGGLPAELAPPPDLALRVLTPRAYATFRAAAMRLVGPRGAEAIRAGRVDPAAAADAWVARLPGLGATLRQGLWLVSSASSRSSPSGGRSRRSAPARRRACSRI